MNVHEYANASPSMTCRLPTGGCDCVNGPLFDQAPVVLLYSIFNTAVMGEYSGGWGGTVVAGAYICIRDGTIVGEGGGVQ